MQLPKRFPWKRGALYRYELSFKISACLEKLLNFTSLTDVFNSWFENQSLGMRKTMSATNANWIRQ